MICDFCKSENLYLKEADGKTGLYCKSCGRWLKWVNLQEKIQISEAIERQKREIRIDGNDVNAVKEKLKAYVKKLETLNSEINYFKSKMDKNQMKSDMEKAAMYERALKMKELNTKILAYREVLTTLRL